MHKKKIGKIYQSIVETRKSWDNMYNNKKYHIYIALFSYHTYVQKCLNMYEVTGAAKLIVRITQVVSQPVWVSGNFQVFTL